MAALVPAALVACGSNAVAPDPDPALADLAARTGAEVTVTAEVAAVVSPRAFTVIGREGSPSEPVLVVHEQATPINEELPVTVAGVIRLFRASQAVGLTSPARLTQYDGKPYIQAREVRVLPQ